MVFIDCFYYTFVMNYQDLIKFSSSNVSLDSIIRNNNLVNYTTHKREKEKTSEDDEIKEILNIHSLELGMDLNIKDTNNEILVKTNEDKEEFEELTKEIILELIKDFDETTLSVRSKNALRNMNCYYVGDILSVNKSELFRVRALGYKSILEIEEYILNLNLKFGDVIEPWTGIIIEELRSSLRDEITTSKKQDLIEKDKYLEVELSRILKECIVSPKKDNIV